MRQFVVRNFSIIKKIDLSSLTDSNRPCHYWYEFSDYKAKLFLIFHSSTQGSGSNSNGYRSILAYYAEGHSHRVNYYSNPNVIFPDTGTPTGVAGISNNAAVLTNNRFMMAALGDESADCSSTPSPGGKISTTILHIS